MSVLSGDQIQVPEGFKLHTENSAHLLLPDSNDAFLNPVQEFNRDLSVACIRVWAAERDEQKKQKWLLNNRRQHDSEKPVGDMQTDDPESSEKSTSLEKEALSATGLRSIRYAKEIPSVKYVLANDLSPAACEAMRRNVEINGLGPGASDSSGSDLGKNSSLMYSHRVGQDRVDVVDLDPYGTAAPFIDAAVQCVKDDVEQAGKGSSGPSYSYKSHAGPTVPQRCPECQSSLHVRFGLPYSGLVLTKLPDGRTYVKVVKHIDEDPSRYGTSTRIKGMVTVASEELPVPFYFTPSKVAGSFRCEVPSLAETT
ncbi:14020_t:CDS:2 [Acaulospora colombiana]|uniref:14020_t:CDS:1 n=1 Tax=Acaulospora colombiana TaxID=27376 RepID=A0ACA9MLL3_9GLOM|nr:14020_t:CDS:2 [Acaulospora colombiana]